MFKRVITLLFCLIIIFVAIFGFAVGVVAVPTIMVYAESDPDLIPYENQIEDSTASIYVFLKDKGFTFSNSATNTVDNVTSFMMIHSMQAYSAATGTDFAQNMQILKNGTGLIDGENGKYYYSTQAQDLLNKFANWFASDNDVTDGIPKNGITYGEYGSLEGADGSKYAVFNWKANDNFYWGSCSALGSVPMGLSNNETVSFSTPWGSSTVKATVSGSTKYKVVLNGSGVFGSGNVIYNDYDEGNGTTEVKYGSPCLAIKNANSSTIYKAIVVYYHRLYKGQERENGYYLYIGDVYQSSVTDPLPLPELPFEYNGDPLPDDSVEPTEPSVVNINYNDYGDIIDNTQNITIINDDPDEPDDTIPYDPYPDNPNYDPSDPTNIHTPPQVPTDPDNPNNINFPDIDLDLPDINWSIGDLSGKFPFSIPFDLVALVRVLDAPPEAPRFDGTLNLGITTYDYDINLEPFSPVASACRIAETLLFVFVLIMITRSLIKG